MSDGPRLKDQIPAVDAQDGGCETASRGFRRIGLTNSEQSLLPLITLGYSKPGVRNSPRNVTWRFWLVNRGPRRGMAFHFLGWLAMVPVSGLARNVLVSGLARNVLVSGLARNAPVSGLACLVPVSELARMVPVSGLARMVPVSGLACMVPVSELARMVPVSGLGRNVPVIPAKAGIQKGRTLENSAL